MSESTPKRSSGRRFWGTVIVFALANLAAWAGYVRYDQWRQAQRPLLRVERFAPGNGQTLAGRPTLSWAFNLDVAPAGGVPEVKEPVGSLSPAVAGRWAWADARTLTFTPDADLPRATRFTVALNPERISTPEGFRLREAYKSTLQTTPLQVLAVRQRAFDEDRLVVEVEFNDKVLPADFISHLSVLDPAGKPLPAALFGEPAGNLLRVRTDPIPAARNGPVGVSVALKPGLAGQSGPLGLPEIVSRVITVGSDLAATEANAFCPPNSDPRLTLRFNNEVDLEALRQVISVEPAVNFTLSRNYRGVMLNGPFQPATRYAVKIAAGSTGGAKRSPRPTTLSVFVPDRPPAVWFDHDEGYLSARGNRTLMAHAVNTPVMKIAVTRVYDSNLVAWRNATDRARWTDTGPFSRPVATKTIELPRDKNQVRDVPIALDDLLPAGAARDGVYRISIGTESRVPLRDDDELDGVSSLMASATVTLSDIGLTAKHGKDGVTAWAVSLASAKPQPGVRVRAFSSKGQPLGTGTTDAHGLAHIATQKPAPGERVAVLLADVPAWDAAPVAGAAQGSKSAPSFSPVRGGEGRDEGLHANGVDATTASAAQPAPHPASPPNTEERGGGRGSTNGPPDDEAVAAADSSNHPTGLTWLDLTTSAISFGQSDIAGRPYLRSGYEAFVYTDRGVYRPGETVHLRAIVRGPDLSAPASFPVRWQIRRPDLRDWKAQQVQLDADGTASFNLQLPDDLPTGRWSAHIGLSGDAGPAAKFFGEVNFQVEEFIPDRMKVAVNLDGVKAPADAKAEPRLDGAKKIAATVQADYLFGQPAAELPATITARIEPTTFRPANWQGWTFGDAAESAEPLGISKPLARRSDLPARATDAKGKAAFQVDLADLIENGEVPDSPNAKHRTARAPARMGGATDYAGPWRLTVAASVAEAGGRAVTAAKQIDVDTTPHYLGVRAMQSSARPGVSAVFELNAVAPDGKAAAAGPVEVTFYRETFNSSLVMEEGHYRYHSTRLLEPVEPQPRKVDLTGTPTRIEFTSPTGGSFVLRAVDPKTKAVASLSFFSSFGEWDDNISRENPEKLDLVLLPPTPKMNVPAFMSAVQKRDVRAAIDAICPTPQVSATLYRPGDTARLLVRSPFPGRLLLSVETDSIVHSQVLEMSSSQTEVAVPVNDVCRPGAFVTATVLRPIDPNARWMPHRAIGVVRLTVDNSDRSLAIRIEAPATIRPATSLGARVIVTDAKGKPVSNAAVTLAAVDEGICRLTNFRTPNPFAFFTDKRALGVKTADLYSQLMPEVIRAAGSVGGDTDVEHAGDARRKPIVSAKRVKPVSLWSGVVHTDASGATQVDFPVPQFSGQLRLMAVAHAGREAPPGFGSGEQAVTVRSPLLVQSSWPRFAAPGDRFIVPLTLFNNTDADGEAKVTIRVEGPVDLTGAKDGVLELSPIAIAKGKQGSAAVEVVAASGRIGVARARLVASLNGQTYEESVELPVRPAHPLITDGGQIIASPDGPTKISIPGGMIEGTRKYDLRIAPRPNLELPRGLDYLERYPYGCLEQTTSTCFPLVYLPDIGKQIAPGVFDADRVAEKVQVGITRLIGMQTPGGGLAMWQGDRTPWPWASVYAAHFVVEARAAGHAVPDDFHDHLLAYLKSLLNQPGDQGQLIETQAYACYVLALAGKPERAAMSRLGEVLNAGARPGVESPEAYGSARFHLAAAWLAAGRRDLAAGLVPKVLPSPRASRELSGNVGSPMRDRAVLLSTLLAVDPDRADLPALAQQIADAGKNGQWRSTQETAFAVMALGRYLRQAKSAVPYGTVELWQQDRKVASATAGGSLVWTAPQDVSAGTALEVRVTGPAGAKAHVSWTHTGVPVVKPTTQPIVADNGVEVRRRYLDRKGKPIDPARVRSGDLVQVELTVRAPSPLEHLVIEDMLPAGLEIENPRLQSGAAVAAANLEDAPADANAFRMTRLDVRDDRLAVIGNLSSTGTGRYVYAARAVAPGEFTVPPVRAECMYDLGTNSLSGGGVLKVLPVEKPVVARS